MAAGVLNWGVPAARITRAISRLRPVAATPRRIGAVPRGTPEIYFAKAIDNSRLVRVSDPARAREMRMFAVACLALGAMLMLYAFQHFSAIEYGYRIQAQKSQRDALVEMNRELRLEEAALRDPQRIDTLARRLGLQSAEVGQVVRLDQPIAEPSTPILASAVPVSGMATTR